MNYRTIRQTGAYICATLIVASSFACQEGQSQADDSTLLLAGLAGALSPTNPGPCAFTFGRNNVPIQEYSSTGAGDLSFTTGFTGLFKNWAAIKVSNVINGTALAFNYAPWYSAGGNSYYLVYNESGCPITNSSNADFNYTFPDLAATRTPTNYTVSGNTLTFNSSGATKQFVIVSASGSVSGSEKVTRTN